MAPNITFTHHLAVQKHDVELQRLDKTIVKLYCFTFTGLEKL